MRSHYNYFLKNNQNAGVTYKMPTYTVLMPPVMNKMLDKVTEIIDSTP